MFSGKRLGGRGGLYWFFFKERKGIGVVSLFSVDFRLSVGAEEEKKGFAWFLLVLSWVDYGFMSLFLNESGRGRILG